MQVVMSDKATLKELETYYDLDDLLFFVACLDIKNEYEAIDSI